MNISDETLSAYLDGALSDDACEQLEAELPTNPDLADRLERLAGNDDRIREAYAEIDALPMPHAVTALLSAQPNTVSRGGEPRQDNVVAFRTRASGATFWQAINRPAAIAASISGLLGIGIGALLMTARVPDPINQALASQGPAMAMLTSTPSGAEVDLKSGVTGKVTLTFTAADGAVCREFELASSDRTASAVACRMPATAWSVRLVGLRNHRAEQNGGYATASASEDEAFGRAVDSMMASDALDSTAEAAMIKANWGSKK